jgi:hypothetical protein
MSLATIFCQRTIQVRETRLLAPRYLTEAWDNMSTTNSKPRTPHTITTVSSTCGLPLRGCCARIVRGLGRLGGLGGLGASFATIWVRLQSIEILRSSVAMLLYTHG